MINNFFSSWFAILIPITCIHEVLSFVVRVASKICVKPENQLISFKDTIPVAVEIVFKLVDIVFKGVIVGIRWPDFPIIEVFLERNCSILIGVNFFHDFLQHSVLNLLHLEGIVVQ